MVDGRWSSGRLTVYAVVGRVHGLITKGYRRPRVKWLFSKISPDKPDTKLKFLRNVIIIPVT